MARPGRKRRMNVARYPGGQIIHRDRAPQERPDEILATVIAYRLKHVGPRHARSQFAGYALGRLLLQKNISGAQHGAGWRWTKLAVEYARAMGFRKPLPTSVPITLVSSGLSCIPEDDEQIAQVRRAYNDAYSALLDHEPVHGGIVRALRDCCLEDRDPASAAALGNLRIALNVLCRLWRQA